MIEMEIVPYKHEDHPDFRIIQRNGDKVIVLPLLAEPDLLTPEWLLQHGFEWLTTESMPPAFDVSIHEDNADFRLLIEKEIHRNQFCVVMEQIQYPDADCVWYDTAIWMQEDIGCGFYEVPDPNIREWTVERFQSLYFALRGEELNCQL